jgi:hypothetical protein
MPYKHLDEAKRDSIKALQNLLANNLSLERAVLIEDLFGKIILKMTTYGMSVMAKQAMPPRCQWPFPTSRASRTLSALMMSPTVWRLLQNIER